MFKRQFTNPYPCTLVLEEKGKLTECVIVCAPQPIVQGYCESGRLFAFAHGVRCQMTMLPG